MVNNAFASVAPFVAFGYFCFPPCQINSLGFSDDFITNPILVIDYITINCGTYDKMPLSLEYLYEKLKHRMSEITNV